MLEISIEFRVVLDFQLAFDQSGLGHAPELAGNCWLLFLDLSRDPTGRAFCAFGGGQVKLNLLGYHRLAAAPMPRPSSA